MEKPKETYEEVISKVIEYLRKRFSRTDRTLKYYKRNWGRVKSYMDSQNISDIDASICRNYLLYEFNNRDFSELTKREKEGVSTVNILIEFSSSLGRIMPTGMEAYNSSPFAATKTISVFQYSPVCALLQKVIVVVISPR